MNITEVEGIGPNTDRSWPMPASTTDELLSGRDAAGARGSRSATGISGS
jgi:hypothetical protein